MPAVIFFLNTFPQSLITLTQRKTVGVDEMEKDLSVSGIKIDQCVQMSRVTHRPLKVRLGLLVMDTSIRKMKERKYEL